MEGLNIMGTAIIAVATLVTGALIGWMCGSLAINERTKQKKNS